MTRSDRGLASVGISAFVSTLLLGWAAPTAPALAAGPDEAAAGARVLFGEGRKLADAGRYAEACLKFEESLRLDPGLGTSFNLADCQEHLGRTASAWARFLDVAAATKLAGQPERERVARARAAALEPRLARLAIVVPWPDDRLVVLRDGRPVGASAWGIPVPVDPGTHRVEATAPARKSWSQDTTVPDAPTTVEVSVPRLEIVPAPPAPLSRALPAESAVGGGTSSLVPNLVPNPAQAASPVPVRRWSPRTIALGALGAAGLAAGTVFALRLRSEDQEARDLCPASTCDNADQKARHDLLVDNAHRDRTLAIVSSSVGAAALLLGAYFWWRSGDRPSATAHASRLSLGAIFPGAGGGAGAGSEVGSAPGAWGARLQGAW